MEPHFHTDCHFILFFLTTKLKNISIIKPADTKHFMDLNISVLSALMSVLIGKHGNMQSQREQKGCCADWMSSSSICVTKARPAGVLHLGVRNGNIIRHLVLHVITDLTGRQHSEGIPAFKASPQPFKLQLKLASEGYIVPALPLWVQTRLLPVLTYRICQPQMKVSLA